jgi:hypothetical protein
MLTSLLTSYLIKAIHKICAILGSDFSANSHFVKNIFQIMNILSRILFLKVATIAYNMKVHLIFYIFIFWISPNFAKYTYGLSPLEQHHKITNENKNKHSSLVVVFREISRCLNFEILII